MCGGRDGGVQKIILIAYLFFTWGPIFGWVYLFFFDYVSSVLLMFTVDNEIDENTKE